MTITHQPSSQPYQLHPGTQLSVERTNPFFHDYAEQTVPLDLPASDHNRSLLGYPDLLGQAQRQSTIEAAISDGEYHAVCRQAILSAQRKGNISTAFYINDGALYAKIQDARLRDIFKDDAITFAGDTLQQRVGNAIAECRLIRKGTSAYSDRLALFPVLVTDDSGSTSDNARKYKAVNLIDPATGDFEGAVRRTETVDGKSVSLVPGYYISPFVKTAYVLRRLFAHYGYTLLPSLLTDTAPFTDMVFLNNVIDTLANGRIALSDIIPDTTVSDTLALFRKKFRCEFAADEQSRTVSVIFLKDMTEATPAADLTRCLTEEPTIQYKAPKDYRRTVLKAKETVPDDPALATADTYDSLASLAQANPAAFLNPATGAFFKPMGYSTTLFVGMVTYQHVADASIPYDTGGDTDTDDVEIPERMPSMRSLFGASYVCYAQRHQGITLFGGDASKRGYIHPYVGDYITVNSTLKGTSDTSDESDGVSTTSANNLLPMLCFSYIIDGKSLGTTTPYDPNSDPYNPTRLSDYALHYHGEDGIFERFYRIHDTLSRNALDTVKMRLLLPQALKQSLPATAKVTVRGTALLIDKLKFTLGGKDAPQECDLRTLLPNASLATAPAIGDLLPHTLWQHHWEAHTDTSEVTESEYNSAIASIGGDRTGEEGLFALELPTADKVGQELHPFTWYFRSDGRYMRSTKWYQVH